MAALALFCLALLLTGHRLVVAQTVYDGLSQTALAPANFCAYNPQSPWRQRLPGNPGSKRPGDNAKARTYITNAGNGRPFWKTVGDQDYQGCSGGYYNCPVDHGMSVFVATTADPQVTFRCDSQQTNYGCWEHDHKTCENFSGEQCTWIYQGYAPANLRPGFNGDESGIGDVNWAVVQPNGDVIEAYHCQIHQPVQTGDELSARAGSRCNNGTGQGIGAMLLSNLVTDRGTNGAINSGPNGMAIGLKYAQTVPPTGDPTSVTPNQAIWMNTSCNGSGFVYPATSDTRHCDNANDGLRTGAHLWLNMTHAQIDAAITAGQVNAAWRGVLYAAHDYGIYLGDTGCGLGSDAPAFGCAWLENQGTQIVANGQHNPWIDWFAQISPGINNTTYQPTIYANPFLPFVTNIEVVDDCYATGTCPDSLPPEACGTGAEGTLTMQALNVHQGAPSWFTADEAWEALGVDTAGRVYAAFSSYLTPGATGDVGILRYVPSTDTVEWLSSVSQIAANAGNLQAGERFAKVHVDFVPWNNKLYFATHDFHDDTIQSEVRGSHVMVYDPATNQFDDLSRFMTNGVAIPQQGIIGMDIVQTTGQLIGITYPVGDLVRVPLSSTSPTASVTTHPVSGQQVTRKVLATTRNGGTGYFSYYPGGTASSPLYAIDAGTGATRQTSNTVAYGLFHGRIKSRDGQTAWLLDEFGRLYQMNVASEGLTDLGYLVGQSVFDQYGAAFGLAISNDERYLFTFLRGQGALYSYEIATGTRTLEGTFADPDRNWDRVPSALTVDHLGNLYMIDHTYQLNGARLLKISGVAHSPPRAGQDLVAYYPFTGNGQDASPAGANPLTLVGNPTFVSTTPLGQGLELNGSTQWGTATSSTSLSLSTDVTLAAWVRPTNALPTSGGHAIVTKINSYFLYGNDPTWCPGNAAEGGIVTPGGTLRLCAPTALPAGQWTHVALSKSGLVLRLYYNGTQVAAQNVTTTFSTSIDPLYVGQDIYGVFGNAPFPGTLDEVRVYNYGLTQAQIQALATPAPEGQAARKVSHRRAPGS